MFGENLFNKLKLKIFNPNSDNGPEEYDQIHINNVSISNGTICVAARRVNRLYGIKDGKLSIQTEIPFGTHNARLLKDNSYIAIMNDTHSDAVCYKDDKKELKKYFKLPLYDKEELVMNHVPDDHARQAFGRGLISYNEKYLIGGSSPATVSIYDLNQGKRIKSVNISMDIRNAIHGLEIWPY